MTIIEAQMILDRFYRLTDPTEEDRFLVEEALQYLIEMTGDPNYMAELGGMYYEQRQFDLARKYYEMAAESDNTYALLGLGYIWYYGRLGERDYEKAFRCFDRAREKGDLNAAYKVADMYRRGCYVEKDPGRFRKIIEELYEKLKKERNPYSKAPEVFVRLAEIREEDGKTWEALSLYEAARLMIARRIADSDFFGDRTIMKEIMEGIYRLQPEGLDEIDLYDLYHLLEQPCTVRFRFEGRPQEVQSLEEDGAVVIRFGSRWFRTTEDFFVGAEIDGERLTALYAELYAFEVVREDGTDKN